MQTFFASCPKNMESLLRAELESLGALNIRETVAGVSFAGTMKQAMRFCLWTRFASRVLLQLIRFKCSDDLELYMGCYGVPWEDYFAVERSIAVEFSGSSARIVNTQYGAQKVKDAVCDHFVKLCGSRPDVDRHDPDIVIYAHLHHGEAVVGLDLSGKAQFFREFERVTGRAPLKENLAAAMLQRAGYAGGNFFDPMCGSGTLLLEAALQATDTAPGLHRRHYAFFNFSSFDKEAWEELTTEARERAAAGLQQAVDRGIKIIGADADAKMIATAQENARRAGLEAVMEFQVCALQDLQDNPFLGSPHPLTIVTNPPYGERMGNFNELIVLYSQLGFKMKSLFAKARLAVISSSEELLSCLRLKTERSYSLFNGPLECQLRVFTLEEGTEAGAAMPLPAPDFINRLNKNYRSLKKWAEREGLNSYRIYDADIPEYNAAVDLYDDYVVLQEYRAPATVAKGLARRRLLDMTAALLLTFKISGDKLIVKSRQRQKGSAQYGKNEDSAHLSVTVSENGLKFIARLDDYLDSGIFFDTRPVRALIKERARGRDFLNLFAYTATASAAAAAGGAAHTLSVDMSRTYLEWGIENFTLNQLPVNEKNEFLQADCLAFLSQEGERRFDLIYIDPPTFSNSKRMSRSFEVERDQTALLANLTRHLKDRGEVIFCCNKRGFKLDAEALLPYGFVECQDISAATIPQDCARDSKIHSCFILTYDRAQQSAEPQPLVDTRGMPRWSKILKGPRGTFAGSVHDSRRSEREPAAGASRIWGQAAREGAYQERAAEEGDLDSRRTGSAAYGPSSSSSGSGRTMSRGPRPKNWQESSLRRPGSRSGGRDGIAGRGRSLDGASLKGRGGSRPGGAKAGTAQPARPARVWGPDGVKEDIK